MKYVLIILWLLASFHGFSQKLKDNFFAGGSKCYRAAILLSKHASKQAIQFISDDGGNNNGCVIPRNYTTKCYGFFCRQELKMQQAHIPVAFRLGSMEQCNKLEQKPGYK
jgi:hypothetical protein